MMFWAAKNNKHFTYTASPGIVMSHGPGPYDTIEVLVGTKKYRGMASEWELVPAMAHAEKLATHLHQPVPIRVVYRR